LRSEPKEEHADVMIIAMGIGSLWRTVSLPFCSSNRLRFDGGDPVDRLALHAFLSRYRYGVVSSLGAEGTVQSALVGIAVTAELEVVFDTVRSSRKYANLRARPECSFVIGCGGGQTAQLEGTAWLPEGEELRRYQEAYFRVWTDGPERLKWPGLVHFVVRPRWIRYSDYDQRPPVILERTDW
jgi:hypothetical protein